MITPKKIKMDNLLYMTAVILASAVTDLGLKLSCSNLSYIIILSNQKLRFSNNRRVIFFQNYMILFNLYPILSGVLLFSCIYFCEIGGCVYI